VEILDLEYHFFSVPTSGTITSLWMYGSTKSALKQKAEDDEWAELLQSSIQNARIDREESVTIKQPEKIEPTKKSLFDVLMLQKKDKPPGRCLYFHQTVPTFYFECFLFAVIPSAKKRKSSSKPVQQKKKSRTRINSDSEDSSSEAPASKENTAEQVFMDLGQKNQGAKYCEDCCMLYYPGQARDDTDHAKYHARFMNCLTFKGWWRYALKFYDRRWKKRE
jgi:hypothetical protein